MTFGQFQAKEQRHSTDGTINVYMFASKLDVMHLKIYFTVLNKRKNEKQMCCVF